tara:strand:- start:1367 stop:1939 length:573 start_codon:yes stop_codon:yes gene_type:complete
METDLLPASALVCAAEDGKPIISDDGSIRFAFEGNANGASNLERFYERCRSAAGRLAHRSPSIAYGQADPAFLKPVARFDMLRFVFTEILDQKALEAWSGERVDSYLPPEDLQTPTSDNNILGPLCNLPMNAIAHGQKGVHVWSLMDGTILTMIEANRDSLTAWRPGDEGLPDVLALSGIDLSEQMKLSS